MKWLILGCLVCLGAWAKSAETNGSGKLPPIVGDEYNKTHQLFLNDFRQSGERLEKLTKEKAEIIERFKAKASFYEEGYEALNKYDLLLVVRNTNAKGDYEKRQQLAADDVANLNTIFQKYLDSKLLPSRVSVNYARKVIRRAMNDLDKLYEACQDPDESNNPELEIVAQQIEDATLKSQLVSDFAKRIGIDIKRELATESSDK